MRCASERNDQIIMVVARISEPLIDQLRNRYHPTLVRSFWTLASRSPKRQEIGIRLTTASLQWVESSSLLVGFQQHLSSREHRRGRARRWVAKWHGKSSASRSATQSSGTALCGFATQLSHLSLALAFHCSDTLLSQRACKMQGSCRHA